ncbi:MAG: DUF4136 domain-containing protein [Cytophagales bacterium]|nr:DUF4136 domain-containing protein [Cytophagales bacterium]
MRLYLLIFILFIIGCSPKVVRFVNDDSSFAQYGTYLVVNFRTNHAELSKDGLELMNNIEMQLHEQLNRRGYQAVSTKPDILLRYEFVSNNNSRSNINNNPYDPFITVNTTTFRESILLFELTDRKTKKLIWQASIDLKQQHKPKKKQEELNKAIVALFNTYPYRALNANPDLSIIE